MPIYTPEAYAPKIKVRSPEERAQLASKLTDEELMAQAIEFYIARIKPGQYLDPVFLKADFLALLHKHAGDKASRGEIYRIRTRLRPYMEAARWAFRIQWIDGAIYLPRDPWARLRQIDVRCTADLRRSLPPDEDGIAWINVYLTPIHEKIKKLLLRPELPYHPPRTIQDQAYDRVLRHAKRFPREDGPHNRDRPETALHDYLYLEHSPHAADGGGYGTDESGIQIHDPDSLLHQHDPDSGIRHAGHWDGGIRPHNPTANNGLTLHGARASSNNGNGSRPQPGEGTFGVQPHEGHGWSGVQPKGG